MNKYVHLLLTVAIAAAGFFFLASGFQQSDLEPNWFGQDCWLGQFNRYCLRPEWFAVGGGLLVAAFLFYRKGGE